MGGTVMNNATAPSGIKAFSCATWSTTPRQQSNHQPASRNTSHRRTPKQEEAMENHPSEAAPRSFFGRALDVVFDMKNSERNEKILRPPLEHALARGDKDAAQKLIDSGVDAGPGYKGCGDRSLLDAAAEGGDVGLISTLLFEKGGMADLNSVSGPKGMSALLRAIYNGHSAAARFLILHGADTSVVDTDGRGALRYAFDYGVEQAVVRDLIISGADPCAVGDTAAPSLLFFRAGGSEDDLNTVSGTKGTTPLHRAIEDGHFEAARLLVFHGTDVRLVDTKMRSALHYTFLHDATVEVVWDVIIAGADVGAKDADGNAPAHLAISRRTDNLAVLRTLLRRGADPNATNNKKESLVHMAADRGKLDCAKALLDAGAKPGTKDIRGDTPLHVAAGRDDMGIVGMLIAKGVDVHAFGDMGKLPIQIAVSQRNVAMTEALLVAGAKLNTLLFWAAGDLDMTKTLLEHGADVKEETSCHEKLTALHVASTGDNAGVVCALIDAGADIDARSSSNGKTSLHRATEEGRWASMEALLRRGANINAEDANGTTPLAALCWRMNPSQQKGRAHFSHGKRSSDIGDFLLKSGADETIINNRGKTPRDILSRKGCRSNKNVQKLIKLLDSAPADRAWRRRGMLLMCLDRARKDRESQEKCMGNAVNRPRREEETHEKDCALLRWDGLPMDAFRVIVGFL